MPPVQPHQAREIAESFGDDPERYHRTRPRYPDALIERIAAALPGRDVLDVGLGTGIVARALEAAGCRVLGVEVDARMAEWARARGHHVEVAAFEAWDPAGRVFDGVVAGQTWHWVDPVAGAAKAAEALRPGGLVALFWNVPQLPPDLARAFSAVYRRVVPDLPVDPWSRPAPELYEPILAKAAGGLEQAGAFAAPERWRFDWRRSCSRDEWLDQLPTFGGHSRIAADRLDELLRGVGAAVDAAGGEVPLSYATVAVAAARR